MKHSEHIIFYTILLCFFSFSCEEDYPRNICTTCTYIHLGNGSNVEVIECLVGTDLDIDEWEETFKAEVRSLGGEWDTLEITCVREPL